MKGIVIEYGNILPLNTRRGRDDLSDDLHDIDVGEAHERHGRIRGTLFRDNIPVGLLDYEDQYDSRSGVINER